MNEIWKDIEGYQGCYQVSTLGRVRSLDRVTGKQGKYCKGQIIKPHISGKARYYIVQLSPSRKWFSIHRLVAKAFIPNIDNKPCIDHIDGDRFNNEVSNLRWVTPSENQNNPISRQRKINSLKGIVRPKGSENKKAVPIKGTNIHDNSVIYFGSLTEAVKYLKIKNCGHISQCINGIRNTAYGYKWEKTC